MSFVPASITTTFGLMLDHIATKANEHLRCRLAADTAIDVRLTRKNPPYFGSSHESVIESPMKPTRSSFIDAGTVLRFSSL
jgi:hypothetical protein